MRPGVMIRGRVVMAPSEIDATEVLKGRQGWVDGCRVYCDGKLLKDVVAYSEDHGQAVVMPADLTGEFMLPQLVVGKVRALPRAVRF